MFSVFMFLFPTSRVTGAALDAYRPRILFGNLSFQSSRLNTTQFVPRKSSSSQGIEICSEASAFRSMNTVMPQLVHAPMRMIGGVGGALSDGRPYPDRNVPHQSLGFKILVPSERVNGLGNWHRTHDLSLMENDSGAIFANSAFVLLYGNANKIVFEGNSRLHVTIAGERSVSPVIKIAVSHWSR